jgi:SAM-dependent methyltransferase
MMADPDEQFYTAEYLASLRPALAGVPGRHVLDLGCGQGRIAIPLTREGYRVTAVDWSDDALAAARRYAGDGPAPEFHRADILAWLGNAADGAYDAVLVLEALYMLEGWRETLTESARMLAPGGVAAFGFRPLLHYLRYHAQRGAYDLLEQTSDEREGRLGALRFNWHTAAEVVRHLEGAGFRDVRCTAIGLLSGVAGDPLEAVARPSRLDARAREALLHAERGWGSAFPDEGRYVPGARAALTSMASGPDTLVIVPAYNDAVTLPGVLAELRPHAEAFDAIVVDDGSTDGTGARARAAGAIVLTLPVNIGNGVAVETGLRHALRHGYRFAAQFDAGGQHTAEGLLRILAVARETGADCVVGSRFLDDASFRPGFLRLAGIRLFS